MINAYETHKKIPISHLHCDISFWCFPLNSLPNREADLCDITIFNITLHFKEHFVPLNNTTAG